MTIQIAQYELLVAAACAGLNSIISLGAICLFYGYLRHRTNFAAFAVIALSVIPIAVFSNFIRVMILILITYYLGESAAQGFLHDFAGLTMFAVALLTVFVIDSMFTRLLHLRTERLRDERRTRRTGARRSPAASSRSAWHLLASRESPPRASRRRTSTISARTSSRRSCPKRSAGGPSFRAAGWSFRPKTSCSRALYSQLLTRVYTIGDGHADHGAGRAKRHADRHPADPSARNSATPPAATSFRQARRHRSTCRVRNSGAEHVRDERAAQTEQIVYWTRIGNHMPTSWTQQRMAVAMDNLRGIIPDAVMVRVSTYGNDKAAALAEVDEFIGAMIGSMAPKVRRVFIG